MATYSLLFGHAEWPDGPPAAPYRPLDADAPSVEPLTLSVPAGLRSRLEATAELEGVAWETWVVRALARSVDPRLATR
jgi:hypothetical protein